MTEIDVSPGDAPLADVIVAVERVCEADGLSLTLKTTLAQHPESVHWHFKKGRERGVLEVTWAPDRRRLWFKIAAGRSAPCQEDAGPRLKLALEATFSGPPVH
jgi:hypothetical protein